MGYKLYLNITCPNSTECTTENLGGGLLTTKCTQHKTLHTLKTDIFKLPHNKNIGKLSSKYELFFLDQAKFSSDPSQILILQYLIPTASLLPPRSLSNFPLVTWNSSLSQSLSCSSSLSLFFHTPFDHTS